MTMPKLVESAGDHDVWEIAFPCEDGSSSSAKGFDLGGLLRTSPWDSRIINAVIRKSARSWWIYFEPEG